MRYLLPVCLAAFSLAAPAAAEPPRVGKPAPDFALETYDGHKVALADLKGSVVLLNYWATWCVPCKRELPLLDAYYRLRGGQGLKIFAITTEDSLPRAKLGQLAAALAIPMVSRAKTRGYGPVGGAVPSNYVIDRQGVVRYAAAGAMTPALMEQVIAPLLAEAPPTP